MKFHKITLQKYRALQKALAPTISAASSTSTTSTPTVDVPPTWRAHGGRTQEKHADRDLFFDVLSSTSSKREAKSYLSRFKTPNVPLQKKLVDRKVDNKEIQRGQINGVNLGCLFLPARAVDSSPVFSQSAVPEKFVDVAIEPLHVALVALKSPQSIDDNTLEGIGLTLSQLAKLGLSCVVVIDPQDEQLAKSSTRDALKWRLEVLGQADRVVAAIDSHGGKGARRLDSIIGFSPMADTGALTIKVRGSARVIHPNLLLKPLRRGIIPVITPIGYTTAGQKAVGVYANEVILALTREFAGISQNSGVEEDLSQMIGKLQLAQKHVSLDRIILLDPYGGIPSTTKSKPSHVFINLEQEYEGIREDLLRSREGIVENDRRNVNASGSSPSPSRQSNRLSQFAETETACLSTEIPVDGRASTDISIKAHLDSLQLVRDALAILPPSSSALLTTPQEAARSTQHSTTFAEPGVGTRPFRNPLIHNLLTDKPIFSSSLPRTRLSPSANSSSPSPSPATFIKRGMPLTIIPDPRLTPWHPPTPSQPPLRLSDPRIDLPRLIHLIEDSFSRPLNAQHYLNRIAHSLAGIIIAGSYEGAAILTWETPPDLPSSLIPGSPAHSARLVPYLDKFAVLRRSQGAGGVADIVFSAMVRDCFPRGVVWRSRRNNPVNKWYFERARGTWKIPVQEGAQGWTMFWTTEGVSGERFRDYERVCRSVGTSWADGGKVLD
ncbi:Amino-acid acetyltransferase, mitochondrial [Lambiella insularis]|nr:Amino-acid acetyltransferase, mitochondrial [Lambiella insularis]